MILVLGSNQETIVTHLYQSLISRGMDAIMIVQSDIPNTIKIIMEAKGDEITGYFLLENSKKILFNGIRSIYARPGVGYFEVYDQYEQKEIDFVNSECLITLTWLLEYGNFLVLNRPSASRSNASKPNQIRLIQALGLQVPKTLVTNDPEAIKEFYENHKGEVIYKSISSVRSIVRKMKEEDFERLDTLRYSPVQVQECIDGIDIRVHVVGQEIFASEICAQESDYRYDRTTSMKRFDLPEEIAQACFTVAYGLNLPLAGIDLRMTPEGEFYCFEANPSPVYIYYERKTNFGLASPEPITDALCHLLNQGNK
ncbi:MAG: RimK domain-containing protein ATP-grasp [Firmicutes bacterium]|nr:RimK domain-containing protein ATP-grasp [Bacillota bacterium]